MTDYFYVPPKFDKTISGCKALCLMLCTNIGGDVWAKLYKKSLYTQYAIVQKEEYSACEDYLLNYQLLSKAQTVSPLNFATINHIYRSCGSLSSLAKQKNRDFLVSHHLGYLFMANYGFPTEDIKNAYYGGVGSDFLNCYSSRNSELLTKINNRGGVNYKKIKKYLYYLSCYSRVNDRDVKLSFKRKYIYALFGNVLIRSLTACLLKLFSLTFKK